MANKSPSWLSRLVKSDKSSSGRTPPSRLDWGTLGREQGHRLVAPTEPKSGPNSTPPQAAAEPDARARRREQVRRAQRTHRDRRATYLKSLESEVARLRARDSAHEAEIQAYKRTIRELKDLVAQHGIPLPADLASHPLVTSPQATIELVGFTDHSQTIRAQMPGGYDGYVSHISPALPVSSESTVSSGEMLAIMTRSDTPNINPTSTVSPSNAISIPMPHPHGLGTSQVGVDFVLALEHVCLSHVGLHSCDPEGSGHAMMLTSPIMSRSPPLALGQTTPPGTGLPNGTRWSVPAVELEKLLDFSDRLDLSGEVTPVEAWQRIRQHPNFPNLTRDGLEALEATLIAGVECHGFGAVIDETYFEQALQQALGSHPIAL